MQKLHELIAIVDELINQEYELGDHGLSIIYDECIDEEALTNEEAYDELISKIIHSGLCSNFAVYEDLEERNDNGIVFLEPVSKEILSIYDKEQFEKFTGGMSESFKDLIKELDTPTEHWIVLSIYDGEV